MKTRKKYITFIVHRSMFSVRRSIFNAALLLLAPLAVQAQKVTFFSPEFEEGVRTHLDLGETDDILQTQLDAITSISLSGLGITDIRDVVYLPAVSDLDLSYNKISDISPLLALESLQRLNLSNNQLENINILAVMETDKMEVDVTNNYIGDFSYFYSPTRCEFTFLGMGLQLERDAPYFDVYQLVASLDEDDRPLVTWRGYTNLGGSTQLRCGSFQKAASLDGATYTAVVEGLSEAAAPVTLSNGQSTASTYVVPLRDVEAAGGATIELDPALPEDYQLAFAHAQHGEVSITGRGLEYTVPADAPADTLFFCYYQGNTLKGRSRYYINTKFLLGDVNGDGKVTPADAIMILYRYFGVNQNGFIVRAADVNRDTRVSPADAIEALYLYFGGSSNNARATKPTVNIQDPE